MQISELHIENFLSYEQASLSLQDRGLLLIEGENRDQGGSNGAGKSSLFDAICWALFGKIHRPNIRGDDILRTGARSTSVSVVLSSDGRRIEVSRYRRDPKHQNGLFLTIDGEDSRGSSVADTQARIQKLIQLDWPTWLSVVLFPQGAHGIASWSDAEQKTVLDSVLNLERFRQARSRAMHWLEKSESRFSQLDIRVREINAALSQLERQIKETQKAIDNYELERKEKVQSAEERVVELEQQDPGDASPIQQRIEQLQKQIDTSRRNDLYNVIEQVENKIRLLREENGAEQARYNMLRQELRAQKIIDPEEELKLHEDCPSCGQRLPDEAREKLYSTFSERAFEQRERAEAVKDQITQIATAMDERDSELLKLQDLLMQSRQTLSDTSSFDDRLREAETELASHQQRVSLWLTNLNNARQSVTAIKGEMNPYTGLLKQLEAQQEALQQELASKQKELSPLEDEIHYLRFWRDGFGNKGVKSLLMSTVTPFLNERANLYMGELSNDQAHIQIRTQKQLKSGEFRDQLSFGVSYPLTGSNYAGKSGGEQRRADLAILFALGDLATNRSSAPVGLRLLDEVFESLDALGCEQVVTLLNRYVVPKCGTCLVMSHNDSIKALFEKRIKVVKERGISRIEEAW